MAREYGVIYHDIWGDSDFRALSTRAQLLYLQLLTSPTLNYAGVADWRPKRIAPLASDLTVRSVERAAGELARGLFVVIDEDTEEVLIRSFLKHDGLLKKPNVTKAMLKAFNATSSDVLRGVVVHELGKLREQFPEWGGFAVEGVSKVLEREPFNPSDLVPFGDSNPSGNPSENDPSLLTPNSLLLTPDSSLPASDDAWTTTKLTQLFESAWKHWPKKVEKQPALDKFILKAKRFDPATLAGDIVRFGDAYAATTEKHFVPGLVTWLNRERWTDELPQLKGKQGGTASWDDVQ